MDQRKIDKLVLALRGDSFDSAACALGAMGPVAVPALRAEFSRSRRPLVRLAIVETISNLRRGEDLPFFAEALLDEDERVWQAAIDALVSQPGQEALRLTRSVLERLSADRTSKEKQLSFLREAVAELQKPHPFSVGEDDGVSSRAPR